MSVCAYCGSELRGEFCAKCGMKNSVPMKVGMTAIMSLFWYSVIGGAVIFLLCALVYFKVI